MALSVSDKIMTKLLLFELNEEKHMTEQEEQTWTNKFINFD